MRQPIDNLITFEEFVTFLQGIPENSCYELHDGELIQMPLPKGKHEEIIGFLIRILMGECIRLKLKYTIPAKTLVKALNRFSGYFPDILLLNQPNLVDEPLWQDESIITKTESIALVIEVVSTNWRDDYYKKLADYGEMGIPEYWIVDYYPFGSKLVIGEIKQPTITIYSLHEGEYQSKQFKGSDRIESVTFPEMNVTALEIFTASC